ncbi:MAG: glycosyltransferase family 39 protein, partial [Alphaproteobacteria bacterium]|nr:glycosyltransferase family 39 protein [Alphaproteobacteria bacterium]
YRLWAEHLRFGYYDHPPMIAWWIRLGVTLVGDNPLGVRLAPVLATGLATCFVAALASTLGASPSTALRSAVWYNATTTIGLGGILATPDAPATFFWIVTLWCLARIWAGRSPAWWLAAGLAAGLALLSKYSALFLAPGVLLWLSLTPDGRRMLRTFWPWAAAVLALAIFGVNVAWNADHHWITFAKQFGRVAASGLSSTYLPELLISQFLLINPMIAIYAVRGVRLGWRGRAAPVSVHLLLLVATSAPFVAYLLLHSLHDRVQGHWPVPVYASLVICAVVAAEQGSKTLAARVLRGVAVACGFGLSGLALLYMAAPPSRSLDGLDPTLPLRGWRELSRAIDQRRGEQQAAWIGTVSYGSLAQLSAERRIAAPIIQITERRRYDGVTSAHPDLSRPGLIVDLARRMTPEDLQRCFSRVTFVGLIERGAPGARKTARYATYRVSGPRVDVLRDGCPDDPADLKTR